MTIEKVLAKRELTRRDFLKVSSGAGAGLLLFGSTGCATGQSNDGQANGEDETINIRLGTVVPSDDLYNEYARRLSDSVAERTNGQVEIEIFPDSSLGSNTEMVEQALAGAPVIAMTDPSYMQDYVPDLGILNGPYLVEAPEDYEAILKSDWFEDAQARLEEEGLKMLALNWYFGTRHIMSNEEIRTPADIEGMRVRIPPSVMWRETFAAMGANPTEVEFSEVYTGLSTDVVDAVESPFATLYSTRMYEVAEVASMTGHFNAIGGFVIGKDFFDTLPADTQEILLEEFQKFGEEESGAAIQQDEEFKERLEEEGVQIVEDVDTQAFAQETEEVYANFPEWSPGLYEQIQGIIEEKG